MYTVDDRDTVRPLGDLPQSSIGAPLPRILADEARLVLAFRLEDRDPQWDGTSVRIVSRDSSGEPMALVRFSGVLAHTLGPPNDEAFDGHPLAARGLQPYGAFEVLESSWIRQLSAMNEVHPYHRPESFTGRRHIILSFHDSTFECCCSEYAVHTVRNSIEGSLRAMRELLK